MGCLLTDPMDAAKDQIVADFQYQYEKALYEREAKEVARKINTTEAAQ